MKSSFKLQVYSFYFQVSIFPPMGFWRKDVVQRALDRHLEAVIAEQRAILEREPDNAKVHFALGTFEYFRGNSDAAVALFRKAIELDPNYAAPHVSLGRIDAMAEAYDLAWKHAREAERLGDPSLVEQLGRYPNLKLGY